MNFLDIILICIVAIFAIRGIYRGLIQEVMSLIAIVFAIFLASEYQHLLTPHLEIYFENSVTINALAYVIIFFGTLIVFWLLAKLIKTFLDIALLGWMDRVAGCLFGAAEGVLVGLILIIFMQSFAADSAWLTESKIAPRAQHLVELLANYAPESMKNTLESRGFHFPSAEEAFDSAKDAMGLNDSGQ